jgi:hypothetical protein
MRADFMKKIVSVILSLIIVSCSGSDITINNSALKLSGEKAYSKTTNLYVNLPNDWFVAEDNECNCIDLWLVKNDYSASIAFKKINYENINDDDNALLQIEQLNKYGKSFVAANLKIDFKNIPSESTFKINQNYFSAYRYKNDKEFYVRTVVFKHLGKFYECEAVAKNSGFADELFSLQNDVLSTLN